MHQLRIWTSFLSSCNMLIFFLSDITSHLSAFLLVPPCHVSYSPSLFLSPSVSPSLQDNTLFTVVGRGVLVSTGHSQARDQTACVFLWYSALRLLNDAVLQIPSQGKACARTHTHTHLQIHTLLQINYHVCDLTFVAVVRANFVMGDRATVSHLSADAQDYIWLKWTAVAWKTSRGIQIHTCTQMCVF